MPDYGFERIGKRLFAEHLVGGNFGNMSVRDGDAGFVIKKTGAYLDAPGEPVFVPFDGPVPKDASSEYRVHLAVYRSTPHKAIVHAHPPYAVAASLVADTDPAAGQRRGDVLSHYPGNSRGARDTGTCGCGRRRDAGQQTGYCTGTRHVCRRINA